MANSIFQMQSYKIHKSFDFESMIDPTIVEEAGGQKIGKMAFPNFSENSCQNLGNSLAFKLLNSYDYFIFSGGIEGFV